MDETGISKAEQVKLLKGLVEEGVRQKRELIFSRREAKDEMVRYGLFFGAVMGISVITLLRDALLSFGLQKESRVLFAFGEIINIVFVLAFVLSAFFMVKFLFAYSKYGKTIRMKDGSEVSFNEAASSIDSMTKRNFRKLIEIRQSMSLSEMEGLHPEPYRFDSANVGYYPAAVNATGPQIDKLKEEIVEKRKACVYELEGISGRKKTNGQWMIVSFVASIATRFLDIPLSKILPADLWGFWLVISYIIFYGGIFSAVFFGIRYLYEKKDKRLLPAITLIDQYENSIENYNYLMTDMEFIGVCAQRRKDPAWNKPTVDAIETKTISMVELTEAVADVESRKTDRKEPSSQKESIYDLSFKTAESTFDKIDWMPSKSTRIDSDTSETQPKPAADMTQAEVSQSEETKVEKTNVEETERAETKREVEAAETLAGTSENERETGANASANASETTTEEDEAYEKRKLEEYMRDLKKRSQEEAEFSEELLNEMERLRNMPEQREEKTVEEPQHPASSNLFYYPTATTREQDPYEEANEMGNSYIDHSAHAAAEIKETEGKEGASFRHRTGGEKDKFNYDGRPKKAAALRRAQASSDEEKFEPTEPIETEAPIAPTAEQPKPEEKKSSLRMNEEFRNSMSEHMRSLQEDYGKKDAAQLDMRNASISERANVRMDRDQGLTISLEDALQDLAAFDEEEEK